MSVSAVNSVLNNSSFTCVTCRVAFKDAELQRLHYKSDWHRYNLKRKVAELPPVTSEEFTRRVNNQRSAEENSKQDKSEYCIVCRKVFCNHNAYENHLNSKKHKEKSLETVERHISGNSELKTNDTSMEADLDSEIEEVDSDEWDEDTENPIDSNNCLFCLHHSPNFIKNLEHMTIEHSFFIPDIEYCTDLVGLLKYLGEKISDGYMCLWCNEKGKTFHSAESARQHMVDKGHCKMIHEGVALAEYADYYDYSSSYPDAQENVDADEEVEIPEVETSEYQLVLPSGVTVGHRSLLRYYKQSIKSNELVCSGNKNTRRLHKVLSSYRALGWTATQQEAAARKARDLHYMKRMQSKYYTKLGVKSNKFQKHFRQQVNF